MTSMDYKPGEQVALLVVIQAYHEGLTAILFNTDGVTLQEEQKDFLL